MNKYLSLELRRNHLHPYHTAVLLCTVTMLAFQYFMAVIPLLDPADPDAGMFSTYEFLIDLNHLLSMACFSILGAVMGARFIVEEYSGKRAILLFSYPVPRKTILCTKLWLVFLYPVISMLLCGIAADGIFFLTESIFPLCSDVLTPGTVLWSLFSLLGHSMLAGMLGLLALWIGFRRKSISVTIVAAVILASLVCQIASAVFFFRPALFILAGAAFFCGTAAVKDMICRVENMEI